MPIFGTQMRDDLQHVSRSFGFDQFGNAAFNSIFGDRLAAFANDDISINFQYNIPTSQVAVATTGTGAVTQDNAHARVSTGGNGTATLKSIFPIRYVPGRAIFARFTAEFVGSNWSSSSALIGNIDNQNGFSVAYKNGEFGVIWRKNYVDTFVPQSAFNGDRLDGTGPSGEILQPQYLNVFQIMWGWLGIAPVQFFVNLGGRWIKFHQLDFANTQEGPHILNPALPISAEAASTANDVSVHTASLSGGTYGGFVSTRGDKFFTTGARNVSVSANTKTSLVTYRNNTTFQSVTNNVLAQAVFISASTDGTKPVTLFIDRDTDQAAGLSGYTSVDANNSVLSYSTSNVTTTGGTPVFSWELSKDSARELDLQPLVLILPPGRYSTFSVLSTGATVVSLSFRHKELF